MCFSATASFTAAAVIGGTSAATLPLVRDRRQLLLAGLPVVFAAHQFLEGVIWRQVDAADGASVRSPAVAVWLFVAWLVLPIWVPIAVALFEPSRRRRAWMFALAGVGAVIGTLLFVSSFVLSADVIVDAHHLRYQLPLDPGWLLAVPYVAATCLPLLLSSHRFVNVFGVAMTASMVVAAIVATKEFSSVWCFFAALLSLGLLVHYALDHRAARSGRSRGRASPAIIDI